VTTTTLFKALAFTAIGVSAVAAIMPGVMFTPHGVDEEAWSNDPCRVLCTDEHLNAGITYLASQEGQFKQTAQDVLAYCFRSTCDVIGSTLTDCMAAAAADPEKMFGFLMGAKALGQQMIRAQM
jgi:hypothetical protein